MDLYFDLDGTLIDCSKRNYIVYKGVTEKLGGKPLSFNKYWQRKTIKESFDSIIRDSKVKNQEDFFKLWFEDIESEKSLAFDEVFSFTLKTLRKLSENNCLHLVTLRHNPENLKKELKRLQITPLFNTIFIGNENLNDKTALLKNSIKDILNSFIIGDTEVDIVAAKNLGVKVIAVNSGIRSKEFLKIYQPDFLVKDISQVVKIIEEKL